MNSPNRLPKPPINLLLLQSDLVGHNDMRQIHRQMILGLEEAFEVNYFDQTQLKEIQQENGLILIWVGSGGTEELFLDLFPRWHSPIVLLNDGISNSLAASLEIASWLKRNEVEFEVIHDIPEQIVKEVRILSRLYEARKQLHGQRIGVIGEPSDWLIASSVDVKLAREKWGLDFVSIELQEVLDTYDCVTHDEVKLDEAARLAIKFREDLVVAKAVTGQTGFMANPSIISQETNQIVLSHCMVDPSLTESYVIRSHYETQSGIALQGILPIGTVTIFKIGGRNLDEHFLTRARLDTNTHYGHFCRTQAQFTLEEPVSYFLKAPIGNHHIILWGDYVEVLEQLFK